MDEYFWNQSQTRVKYRRRILLNRNGLENHPHGVEHLSSSRSREEILGMENS